MESKTEETKICKHCRSEISKKAKVCPNCRKKQGSKLKIIGIVFLVMLVIGAIGSSGEENDMAEETTRNISASNTEKPSKEPKPTNTPIPTPTPIAYTVISVKELVEVLETNALKAEKTYQDQYVEVTGRLSVIDSDGQYIKLVETGNEWAIMGVQCFIENDSQLDKVLEMSIGDTVTLTGKITSIGEVLGYCLDIDEIK